MPNTPTPPLDGIRIIDFTQVMLGPSATQMLADFGADVIKIEKPGSGELSRNFFGGGNAADQNNPVFCSLNRNKRSVALNLKDAADRKTIVELIRNADVVVNNFRPGVMDRLGLGYATLSGVNPRLIYASGTGFGEKGPYVHKGGQDVLAQAMTGVMERRADETIPRSIYPTALCDYTAGMHLVQGVLAALLAREKTGRGQQISVSLYDSMIAMQMQEAAVWQTHQKDLNWAAMPLSGVFETKDGAVVLVGAFKANPLRDICTALDYEDLSERFPDLKAQRANKPYLQGRFREGFARWSTEECLRRLEEQDLLCAPVRNLVQALGDEQTSVNGMLATIEHPIHGAMQIVASPVHMSDAPFEIRLLPPSLGEHTQEVLSELEGAERKTEAGIA